MITESTAPGTATVRLTPDELHMINNALNEVCNALDVDFPTRMGVEREEAVAFLGQVHALLDRLRKT